MPTIDDMLEDFGLEQEKKQEQEKKEVEKQTIANYAKTIVDSIIESAESIVEADKTVRKVEVVSDKQADALQKALVSELTKVREELKTDPIDLGPLTQVLEQAVNELKSLPKELPKYPEAPEPVEAVTVKNMAEMGSYVAKVEKAVQTMSTELKKAISKIDVKPDVTVSPTPVEVEAQDLQPLLDEISAMRAEIRELRDKEQPEVDLGPVVAASKKTTESIQALRFPVPNFIQDPLIRYRIADNDDASSVKYYGYVDPEGNWYIMKEDASVAPKTYRYAFGNGKGATSNQYPAKWIDRANLTYDLYYTVQL